MKQARSVDQYIEMNTEWAAVLRKLRKILDDAGLQESIKWGGPCYTLDDANLVGMSAFAEHVALWFYQGVFLKDADQVLVNAGEGKTKALRQWRFPIL